MKPVSERAGVRLSIRTAPSTNRSRVKQMKASTKNKAARKLREVEGALEEAVREAARNRDGKAEGKRQKRVGKAVTP